MTRPAIKINIKLCWSEAFGLTAHPHLEVESTSSEAYGKKPL